MASHADKEADGASPKDKKDSHEKGESGSEHMANENVDSDHSRERSPSRKSPSDGDGADAEVGETNRPRKAGETSNAVSGKGKAGKLSQVKSSKRKTDHESDSSVKSDKRKTDHESDSSVQDNRQARSRSRRIYASDSGTPSESEHPVHKRRQRKRSRPVSPRSRRSQSRHAHSGSGHKSHKRRRSRTRSPSPYFTSSDESSYDSSSSGSYEAYCPDMDSRVDHWRMSPHCSKYAEKHFANYIEEGSLKDTLATNPKPSHSFLKVEEIDASLEHGLPDKLGASQASVVLNRDKNFCRIQEKVQRVMGPLGRLWQELDKGRKKSSGRKVNLANILQLAEQSVLLLGQTNVAVRYLRRYEVTTAITKNSKEAKTMLKRYEKYLHDTSALFGPKFQSKVDKEKGARSSKGLLSITKKKPSKGFRKGQRGDDRREQQRSRTGGQPFRGRSFRGGQSRGGRRGGNSSRGRGGGKQIPNPTNASRYVCFFFAPTKSHRSERRSSIRRCGSGKRQPHVTFFLDGRRSNPRRHSPAGPRVAGHRHTSHRRPSAVVRSQLDQNHTRSARSGGGAGVSHPVRKHASCSSSCVHPAVLQSGDQSPAGGGEQIAQQRSNCGVTRGRGRVCEPPVPAPEKRQVPASDLQPEEIKRSRAVSALQNGGRTDSKEPLEGKRLVAQGRPQGRILVRPDDTTASAVSEVQMGRKDLPIQVSSVRPSLSSARLHQNHETHCGVVKGAGDANGHLPGRYAADASRSSCSTTGREDTLLPPGTSGICGELAKVCVGTMSDHRVSGNDAQFRLDAVKPAKGQGGQDPPAVSGAGGPTTSLCANTGQVDRSAVIDNAGSVTSPPPLPRAPDAQDQGTDEREVVRDHDNAHPGVLGRVAVVDNASRTVQCQVSSLSRSGPDHRVRCQSDRMGCGSSRTRGEGPLDAGRVGGPDQCPGAESGVVSSEDIRQTTLRDSCSRPGGQQDCHGPHKPDGGHKVQKAGGYHPAALAVLPRPENIVVSGVSARKAEHSSGSSVTIGPGGQRLAARQGGVCAARTPLGTLLMGPLCQQAKYADGQVRELEVRSRCSSDRRAAAAMDGRVVVCLPSILPHSQVSGQSLAGSGRDGVGSSGVAYAAMVPRTLGSVGCTTSTVAGVANFATISTRSTTSAAAARDPAVSGMESFRLRACSEGISEESADLLSKSWRRGTRTAYDSAWQKWAGWCHERDIDPVSAPVARIVDFLTDMFHHGYQYSTLNGYRSAISAFHVDGVSVGQHSLVRRVLTGSFNERPPQPRYKHTWDVNMVLNHLESLGPNESLDDGQLTRKLAMLLALTTAARASDLQALELSHFEDRGDRLVFTIVKLTKTRRPGDKHQEVVLVQYDRRAELDVVQCTRDYILRTCNWRVSEAHHQLLLGSVRPHNPVVPCTIAKWLLKVMESSGVDTTQYKAHSTRSASTSKAKATGLSVAEIMQRANWRSATTFRRYYDKDQESVEAAFAESVLG